MALIASDVLPVRANTAPGKLRSWVAGTLAVPSSEAYPFEAPLLFWVSIVVVAGVPELLVIHRGTNDAEQIPEVPDVIVVGQLMPESPSVRMLALPPELAVIPPDPVYRKTVPLSDASEFPMVFAAVYLVTKFTVPVAEVVFPDPDTVWQLPSPRRNVVAEQEPVHKAMTSEDAAAVNAEVPLPLRSPVSEAAPDPPLVTGTTENEVVGVVPTPPPRTNCPDPRTPEDAQPVALLKKGIPPEVPATVKAKVVVPVTEMIPPEKVAPMTVPAPAGA